MIARQKTRPATYLAGGLIAVASCAAVIGILAPDNAPPNGLQVSYPTERDSVASTAGLRLRTIVQPSGAEPAQAFLSILEQPARGYRVGDTLPGGAVITAIERDHILLKVGARFEILTLVGDLATEEPIVRAPQPIEPRERPATQAEFLDSLGAAPVPGGYKIGDAPPASMTKVGFEPGDIIVRVNGKLMGNVAKDQKTFADAATIGFARFDIDRQGVSLSLTYPPQ